jgi:hypothetical protein
VHKGKAFQWVDSFEIGIQESKLRGRILEWFGQVRSRSTSWAVHVWEVHRSGGSDMGAARVDTVNVLRETSSAGRTGLGAAMLRSTTGIA